MKWTRTEMIDGFLWKSVAWKASARNLRCVRTRFPFPGMAVKKPRKISVKSQTGNSNSLKLIWILRSVQNVELSPKRLKGCSFAWKLENLVDVKLAKKNAFGEKKPASAALGIVLTERKTSCVFQSQLGIDFKCFDSRPFLPVSCCFCLQAVWFMWQSSSSCDEHLEAVPPPPC